MKPSDLQFATPAAPITQPPNPFENAQETFKTAREIAFPKFSFFSSTFMATLYNFLFYLIPKIVLMFTYKDYSCVLYRLGILYPPDLRSGEVYRLIIPTLFHFNFWHMLFNSIFILALGFEIEAIIGRAKMLLLYFSAAFFGFLFSAIGFPHTLTTGCSASIFGMFHLNL